METCLLLKTDGDLGLKLDEVPFRFVLVAYRLAMQYDAQNSKHLFNIDNPTSNKSYSRRAYIVLSISFLYVSTRE